MRLNCLMVLTFWQNHNHVLKLIDISFHLRETCIYQLFELLEIATLSAIHHLEVLFSQLKWSFLCLYQLIAWTYLKEKPKVNVHQKALPSQKDISVVPIFYSENIAKDTIGC